MPEKNNGEFKLIPPDNLLLDKHNPRLTGLLPAGADPSQEDLLRVMCENMSLNELASSIASAGFYRHDPLLAEKLDGGQYVVIEGNRRLATVRLLMGDEQLRDTFKMTDLPLLGDEDRKSLERLPVWVVSRKNAWQAIAYKHIHGPRRWTSCAKAEYIATLREKHNLSLREIAQKIGDNYSTVRRLHHALMAIRQAEKAKVFDRDDRWNATLAISHFYNGISHDSISAFIGLPAPDAPEEFPIPKDKEKELGELLVWLYGSRKEGRKPQIKSQNPDIHNLAQVLAAGDEGLSMLRARMSLDEAVEAAEGDRTVLFRHLARAREELQKAIGKTSGFAGERDLERLAHSISDLAEDLLDLMDRSDNRRRRKKRSGGK